MAGVAAAVAIGVDIVATYQANQEQKKSNALQEKALEMQATQARLQNLATRRAEARKAMRERALARNSAASDGATTTSALTTTLSSIQNNAMHRISFLDSMSNLESRKFAFQKEANRHLSKARDYQALGQVAGTIYGAAGGSDALATLY
jgi:hypothetical protein